MGWCLLSACRPLLLLGLVSLASAAPVRNCMASLLDLSGISEDVLNETEALLRDNGYDQPLIDDFNSYQDVSALFLEVGITSSARRARLYTCLNRGASTESPCRTQNPCGHGMCAYVSGNFKCKCQPGYTGDDCMQELNECELRRPCLNGGTCQDHVNNFTCTCVQGFFGRRCETDRNECASTPCEHGTCTDIINGFHCTCDIGYTGTVCDEDLDECASSPCQHGTCEDMFNNYQCHCEAGYTGSQCQTELNECVSQPCSNGGSCRDAVNNFTCLCSLGYEGRHCETKWFSRSSYENKMVTPYTRWGRSTCPDSAEVVYTGIASGAHHGHTGSGANLLCLHTDPLYVRYADYRWGGIAYGVTYQLHGQSQPYPSSFEGKTAPCVVCLAKNKTTTVMIPARNVCPHTWRREYFGYLMAPYYNSHSRGEYSCFDDRIEGVGPYGNPGHNISPVQSDQPNGLPPRYTIARELTCAVCSK